MVTYAQAQERAEEWVNGDVPAYQHREVRVREFELGFVVWGEDRAEGPRSDAGAQRLVIARDSGEATLWPALPVGEVIRRYEEEYGRPDGPQDAVPAPAAARVDLNQTSFLLSPPEWLQEAADKLGIGERRPAASEGSAAGSGASSGGAGLAETQAGVPVAGGVSGGAAAPAEVPEVPEGATPWAGTDTNADGGEDDRSVPLPATVFAPPLSDSEDEAPHPPAATPEARTALLPGGSQLPPTAVAPALDPAQAPGVPQGSPPPPPPPGTPPYGYPQTAPGYGYPQPPGGVPHAARPGTDTGDGAERRLAPHAGDIADAATSKAAPPPKRARGPVGAPPPPPGVPGAPGVRPGDAVTPPAPGAPAGGYVPTQLVSSLGSEGPGGPAAPGSAEGAQAPGAPQSPGTPAGGPPGTPPAGVHHAATVLADPNQLGGGAQGGPGAPGAPNPPGAPAFPGAPGTPNAPAAPAIPNAPGAPGVPGAPGAVHHAETVLSGPPVPGPGTPPSPPAPGAPGMPPPVPGAPGAPAPVGPPQPMPPAGPVPGQVPAYGYPQQGRPTVGPGYQAVLRYRAQDGSEQQLIRRSAPGMPHPEWQIFHELRAMNVPPDQVLELHTELESCELPGAYCARMIREQWPQARIASIAPYGTDHASRQQGMRELLAHQGELHQVADGPARPAPVRAPLPPVQAAPAIPPEGIAQELAAVFGPGVFRFEHQAVSRQGVPPVVAHTLVVAGLPVDLGPFFWAQAQPGRPVPTLAELAAERGVRPAADAGSYLVMGTDFGKALCVQYGTANIVAVPVEAGPGGAPVPPQFVNSGLPEFTRCLALLGRMWRLRYGLNQEQAGRWTVDFQAQLASLDPAALGSPESWWSVLLEQLWDGLL
ncbi:SUKH-4 family immunity protein [Streptomyces sp. LP11]|uniref:SUKH-4 family immunity protein n=1 Tax=Streptomyces pyxinicus TaxID=2970331 RepID=A0ABT2AVF2_9ACTN|nr:SUKH-4 family immunity protein [Streptomyces sp. LP11]MCS0600227.1 SUKH-4 family immunity protein [Streptomyces sp. LP11]